MTKAQIIDYFKRVSGRGDLDTAAVTYLDGALTLLETKTPVFMDTGTYAENLTVGQDRVYVKWLMHPKDVLYIVNDEMHKLTRVHYALFKNSRVNVNYAYCLVSGRLSPVLEGMTSGELAELGDLNAVNPPESETCVILFKPVGVEGSKLIVNGKFKSVRFSAMEDGDSNFWSVKYPDVLVRCAHYLLALEYDNPEKTGLMLNSIRDMVDGIVRDSINMTFGDGNLVMEG